MTHSKSNLVELLLQAYNEELESGMNYLSYGSSLEGVKGEVVGEKLLQDVGEEFGHAELIANHLDVKFDILVPNSSDFEANQDYFENLDLEYRNKNNIEEVIDAVIEAESNAVELYTKIVKVSEELGFYSTRDMAEQLLADEEDHLDEFESLKESF